MSVKNRVYPFCRNSQKWPLCAGKRVHGLVCAVVILATFPFVSGCGPDVLIGAMAFSVLSAHLSKDSFPVRQPEPKITRPVNLPYAREPKRMSTKAVGSYYARKPEPTMTKPAGQPNVRKPKPKITRPASEAYVRRAKVYSTNDKPPARISVATQHTPSQSKKPPAYTSPLTEAVQAYKEMQWDKAALLLNKAIDAERLSRSELCRAYILLGGMVYQNGSLSEAKQYFARAYRHDPAITPSLDIFPPQVLKFYKSVRKR